MLRLIVISPEANLLEKDVEYVELPGTLGRFVVLPSHAPLISSLTKGSVKYRIDGLEEHIDVESGFAEVLDDVITVCVEQ